MIDVIKTAAQVSNLQWVESKRVEKPLSIKELFYLATKGGGSFFGKVGSFESGYKFDALIIEDSNLTRFKDLTIEERLEKFIYTGSDKNIMDRYIEGKKVERPDFS